MELSELLELVVRTAVSGIEGIWFDFGEPPSSFGDSELKTSECFTREFEDNVILSFSLSSDKLKFFFVQPTVLHVFCKVACKGWIFGVSSCRFENNLLRPLPDMDPKFGFSSSINFLGLNSVLFACWNPLGDNAPRDCLLVCFNSFSGIVISEIGIFGSEEGGIWIVKESKCSCGGSEGVGESSIGSWERGDVEIEERGLEEKVWKEGIGMEREGDEESKEEDWEGGVGIDNEGEEESKEEGCEEGIGMEGKGRGNDGEEGSEEGGKGEGGEIENCSKLISNGSSWMFVACLFNSSKVISWTFSFSWSSFSLLSFSVCFWIVSFVLVLSS